MLDDSVSEEQEGHNTKKNKKRNLEFDFVSSEEDEVAFRQRLIQDSDEEDQLQAANDNESDQMSDIWIH